MMEFESHPDRVGLESAGQEMMALIDRLWPVYRTLAGPGIRETLGILGESLGGLSISHAATGTRILESFVPDEWHLRRAFLETPDGRRICDTAVNISMSSATASQSIRASRSSNCSHTSIRYLTNLTRSPM